MTSQAKKLLDEALQLSPADRESLAGQLFDSLEAEDPDADAAWEAEVQQRLAELDQGAIKPIPWAEARQLIFGQSDALP